MVVNTMTDCELVTEVDKAWIACAIDGEGSVNLQQQLAVTNTKPEFLDRAYSILSKLGANHIIRHEIFISINNRVDLLKVLPQIIPYLVIESKIQTAKLIIEHCKKSLAIESQAINKYIFNLIKNNPQITTNELRKKSVYSTFNEYNKIYFLEKKGYIKRIPTGKSTKWEAVRQSFDEIDFLNCKRVMKV